ncbi:MAG: aldehyde dehydrogenase (NADP(+)) [Acidimicrobiia bacterium]|nr:aldehyde dehydrogenase (NADP(+)) [Acidimicrobiia bacterium]
MTTVRSTNPRTGDEVPTKSTETTEPELQDIMERASVASARLGAVSPSVQAAALRSVASALHNERTSLAELADRETALGLPRLEGEVGRAAAQFELFASVVDDGEFLEATIDHADPDSGQPDVRRVLEPIGPVAVFGASNFPFAFSIAGGDTASALAAGNAVVAKAHPSHPATSDASALTIRSALEAAGLPPDSLSVVHGVEAGAALVQHPRIQAVGFTGSLAGGRALHDLAMSRSSPIPFYGELGSLNPVVVTPAAAATRGTGIAQGFLESYTLGVGQFCTKPGIVLVPKSAASGFVEHLAERIVAHEGGFLLNQSIKRAFRAHLDSLNVDGEPLELLVSQPADTDGTKAGIALAVVDADAVDWTASPLAHECFGPFAVVVRYDSIDQALNVLSALPASLTATIHAEDGDPDSAAVFAALRQEAGRVVWNGFPTGVRIGWAMHHGGRYPASTNPLHTSVGASSVRRFLRPVAYQGVPDTHLPYSLRDGNPLALPRRVDGQRLLP